MSIEDGDDQKRVKVPSISSAFIYSVNQSFTLVEVPKGKHEHPMRPSLWQVQRTDEHGVKTIVSTPSTMKYATRDLNACKFGMAFQKLEGMMEGDFPNSYVSAWEYTANFDHDNAGYPYQAYAGNWLKVLRTYIQEIKQSYHEEYY